MYLKYDFLLKLPILFWLYRMNIGMIPGYIMCRVMWLLPDIYSYEKLKNMNQHLIRAGEVPQYQSHILMF